MLVQTQWREPMTITNGVLTALIPQPQERKRPGPKPKPKPLREPKMQNRPKEYIVATRARTRFSKDLPGATLEVVDHFLPSLVGSSYWVMEVLKSSMVCMNPMGEVEKWTLPRSGQLVYDGETATIDLGYERVIVLKLKKA